MTFQIAHVTRYRYSLPVNECHNEARLKPRLAAFQACESFQVTVDPQPKVMSARQDYFGNPVLYFGVDTPHQVLTITATSVVGVRPRPRPILTASRPWDRLAAQLAEASDAPALDAREFVLDSPLVTARPELAAFARPAFPPGRPLLEAAHELNQRIHQAFVYDPHFTTVATPLATVFAERRGVCQDFAHLAIGCLRALGLPARYVSGYLESVPPPGAQRLRGADASHAWFAVFDPDAGWVGFDPTNDQIVDTQHVTLAWGRDYADVTPVKGVLLGGGAHSIDVAVDVVRTGTDNDLVSPGP